MKEITLDDGKKITAKDNKKTMKGKHMLDRAQELWIAKFGDAKGIKHG